MDTLLESSHFGEVSTYGKFKMKCLYVLTMTVCLSIGGIHLCYLPMSRGLTVPVTSSVLCCSILSQFVDFTVHAQGRRQDFAWVGASARGVSVSGGPGVFSSRKFEKSSCLSPHFLHSEIHFNPHSPIRRTSVACVWVWTHPSHPPAYGPDATCNW